MGITSGSSTIYGAITVINRDVSLQKPKIVEVKTVGVTYTTATNDMLKLAVIPNFDTATKTGIKASSFALTTKIRIIDPTTDKENMDMKLFRAPILKKMKPPNKLPRTLATCDASILLNKCLQAQLPGIPNYSL